ncbi:MAG: PAS domain S-box protein, partial [Bacteroidetes bacterium]|nr:PAS domain S-box protein [Bacteroidota bacterium]
MKESIIIGLLQNIGILLAFALLYETVWLKKVDQKSIFSKLISGIVIGGIGILLMFTPWTLVPGLIFDTRSILLAISGLFFGFIPTLIAMLMTSLLRFWLGGDGMWMGIAVIFSSGSIGLLWAKFHHLISIKNVYIDLLLMGLLVHLAMLGCTAFLPSGTFFSTINNIALPLIFIYSPGTMLLGIFMLNQTKNVQNRFAFKKLTELERRLSQIMKSGNIVSIILDTHANITFCNKYLLDLTKYTKEEVLHQNWYNLFMPKELNDSANQEFTVNLNENTFIKYSENEIIGKYGDRFFLSWYNTRLFNENNEIIGMACLGVDLTDRKLFEQQLHETNEKLEEKNRQHILLNQELVVAKDKAEESDRLKSAFLANLSHEIRTPMNAIMGFTDLLREPNLNGEDRENYINVVHKSGRHLLSIINDIIEISRIEAGYTELHSDPVHLNSFFDDLYQTLNVTIPKEKSIKLLVDIPQVELRIFTDEIKLRQILINLISNALKYTEKGTVAFGYRKRDPGELFFWVEDTGIGIDRKYHELIFNRFRQVDEELKFARGGFGLGLAISKAFVEMMGGKIELFSEPGKGSRFSFSIPLIESNEELPEIVAPLVHKRITP